MPLADAFTIFYMIYIFEPFLNTKEIILFFKFVETTDICLKNIYEKKSHPENVFVFLCFPPLGATHTLKHGIVVSEH